MSHEFLAQLLRSENQVILHPSEVCHICLEEYGRVSSENVKLEWPIRLPCSHVVGSACITEWLRTNNTCPICRRQFFPSQQRASDPDVEYERWQADDEEIIESSSQLGREMRFSSSMHGIVEDMARNTLPQISYAGHTPRCAVALAIYMMSHVMGEIQYLNEMDEIARISDIPTASLRQAYQLVYPDRERLIPENLPAAILRNSGINIRFLVFLPDPSSQTVLTEHGEEPVCNKDLETNELSKERDQDTFENRHISMGDLCRRFCIELGYSGAAIDLSMSITRRIWRYLLDGWSPRRIAAVSVFVMSHLAGDYTNVDFKESVETISNVASVSEVTLRKDYTAVYDQRHEVLRGDMLKIIGNINIQRALQAVPPLAWPSL